MNRETKTIKSVYRRPTIEVVGVQCLAQLLQASAVDMLLIPVLLPLIAN